MNKNTLIRSDKQHTVKMAEGDNVAQRKSVKKSSPQSTQDDTPENLQKLPPVKTTKTHLASHAEPIAKPIRKRSNSTKLNAPSAAQNAAPSEPIGPLWESDNPIKSRIEQLKTRNAQLAEQLQRLPSARPARGQRP